MGRKGGPDRGAAPRAALQPPPPGKVARRMPRRMRVFLSRLSHDLSEGFHPAGRESLLWHPETEAGLYSLFLMVSSRNAPAVDLPIGPKHPSQDRNRAGLAGGFRRNFPGDDHSLPVVLGLEELLVESGLLRDESICEDAAAQEEPPSMDQGEMASSWRDSSMKPGPSQPHSSNTLFIRKQERSRRPPR